MAPYFLIALVHVGIADASPDPMSVFCTFPMEKSPTSVLVVFLLLWWNAMIKEVSRRKGLFLTLVLEGESLMLGSHSTRSRKLRDHIIFNCKHKSGPGYETSKSSSFDILSPARPCLRNLPTHCHWLGIKCSNTWTGGGYSPQINTPSVACSVSLSQIFIFLCRNILVVKHTNHPSSKTLPACPR